MSSEQNPTNGLAVSQQRYDRLVASIQGIVWEVDPATRQFTFVSQQAEELLGYPLGQWRDLDFWVDHLHPEDRDWARERYQQAIDERRNQPIEYRMIAADGQTIWLQDTVRVVVEGGATRKLYGIMVDISERKQAEALLRANDARFRALVENTWDGISLVSADGEILYSTPGSERLGGYDPGDFVGKTGFAIIHPDDLPQVLARFGKLLQAPGDIVHEEYRIQHKDGSWRWVEGIAQNLLAEPNIQAIVVNTRDITERKQTEQALLESHNLLHAILEGTTDAVFVKDQQGRYLMINAAGAAFLGKTVAEVIGKDDREWFAPDIAQAVMARDQAVITSGEPRINEGSATAAGVTRTYLTTRSAFRDAQGQIIGLIGLSHDVTEIKRLEEQLRQAQKMEAVGQLAGGVAHDFNNLLTVINGYSTLVYKQLPTDDPNRKRLAEIQKAGERAANLTRQLLAFSRKQILQPQIVNLNLRLAELLKLLRPLIGEDIELNLLPDPDLGLAKVDPGQFEQTIINLAVNARDAMPQGGHLTITTRNTVLDEPYAQQRPEVKPGDYILVVVSDSGQGMDEATQARIFEPFFTTKPPGKGTGLGLAMVYGFVKQSGGQIEVFSELGQGTTFQIYLPRAAATPPTPSSSTSFQAVAEGTETVLLVEDEDAVRALCKLALQTSGYTVLEARNGQEAVAVATQHPAAIDLLVTDLVMPRMNGRQLADQLMQAWPHLHILFMSGYTDEAVVRHGVSEANITLLQKPFAPAQFVQKVQEVLQAKQPGVANRQE